MSISGNGCLSLMIGLSVTRVLISKYIYNTILAGVVDCADSTHSALYSSAARVVEEY